MIRNGKIACLPRALREELNRRLANGERGNALLNWLNSLPEMQAILKNQFDNVPLSKQNLHEWRAGGFAEWQARQELMSQARELSADGAELTQATDRHLTDNLAAVLAARYAVLLAGWKGEADEKLMRELKLLRTFCQDIALLRRGDHKDTWLKLQQERLEQTRERTEDEVVEEFKVWLENEAVQQVVLARQISRKERERRLREIMGREPLPPKTEAEDNAERAAKIREIYNMPPLPPPPVAEDEEEETTENHPKPGPVKPGQSQSKYFDHAEAGENGPVAVAVPEAVNDE